VTDAGKQTSAAIENNVSLNQTNYAYVDSVAAGATAAVRVYGVGGPYRAYQRVTWRETPDSAIRDDVNVPFGSDQFVSWDGAKFRIAPILSGIFPDQHEPVGKVSVVFSGAPVLPAVSLVLGTGGAVLGWNVTNTRKRTHGPGHAHHRDGNRHGCNRGHADD
jgi:hypothetical protein